MKLIRHSCAALLLAALAASVLSAASGILEFYVRDSRTHYVVHGTLKGEGPESFSMTTDARGYIKRVLPAGDYRLEISASGYTMMRTHFAVQDGKITKAGAFLDSESLPPEESREVLDPKLRPGHTLLHAYVVDADTGEPLAGVTVRLVKAAVATQTDSKGPFALSTPTPQLATQGGGGTDTLIYEKPGYKTIIFRNFGISTEEMGPVGIGMEKGNGVIDQDATHKLMRKQSENRDTPQSVSDAPSISSEHCAWLGSAGTSFSVVEPDQSPPRLTRYLPAQTGFQTVQ